MTTTMLDRTIEALHASLDDYIQYLNTLPNEETEGSIISPRIALFHKHNGRILEIPSSFSLELGYALVQQLLKEADHAGGYVVSQEVFYSTVDMASMTVENAQAAYRNGLLERHDGIFLYGQDRDGHERVLFFDLCRDDFGKRVLKLRNDVTNPGPRSRLVPETPQGGFMNLLGKGREKEVIESLSEEDRSLLNIAVRIVKRKLFEQDQPLH